MTMDTDHPYVGEHTPLVKLSSTEAHGIQQAGLAVRKGQIVHGPRRPGRYTWHNGEGEPDLGQCRELIARRSSLAKSALNIASSR